MTRYIVTGFKANNEMTKIIIEAMSAEEALQRVFKKYSGIRFSKKLVRNYNEYIKGI